MQIKPNFFIVGAPKAGTTSLYEYLKTVPSIYFSPVKEPEFFSRIIVPNKKPFYPIRDEEKYLSLFKKAKNAKIIGEASTFYLSDPGSAKLIHDFSPNSYILISIRDPISRLVSHYSMLKKLGHTKLSIHDQIKRDLDPKVTNESEHIRAKTGLYFEDIQRYQKLFGPKKVKVIVFEEWIRNPLPTLNEIIQFLNLDYSLKDFSNEVFNKFQEESSIPRNDISYSLMYSKDAPKIYNIMPKFGKKIIRKVLLKKSYSPKPELDKEDFDLLFQYYKDDVKRIYDFFGRTLPWKNFKKI